MASSSSCCAIRPGPRLVGIDQPLGIGVQRDVVGLGPRHFALSALNLFFGVMHGSLGLVDLRHQSREFPAPPALVPVHAVADIDVDVLDVAGHLGVQFDVLVRQNWPAIESELAIAARCAEATAAHATRSPLPSLAGVPARTRFT